jgi:hypothetical protein
VESVSGFAVFIGGKNSAFGTIFLILMGLAILFSVVGFSWPRPRLRKGPTVGNFRPGRRLFRGILRSSHSFTGY